MSNCRSEGPLANVQKYRDTHYQTQPSEAKVANELLPVARAKFMASRQAGLIKA